MCMYMEVPSVLFTPGGSWVSSEVIPLATHTVMWAVTCLMPGDPLLVYNVCPRSKLDSHMSHAWRSAACVCQRCNLGSHMCLGIGCLCMQSGHLHVGPPISISSESSLYCLLLLPLSRPSPLLPSPPPSPLPSFPSLAARRTLAVERRLRAVARA